SRLVFCPRLRRLRMKDSPRTVSAPLPLTCLLVFLLCSSVLGQNASPRVTVWLYRLGVDNFASPMPLYVDGRNVVSLAPSHSFASAPSRADEPDSLAGGQVGEQRLRLSLPVVEVYVRVQYLVLEPVLRRRQLRAASDGEVLEARQRSEINLGLRHQRLEVV